MPTLGFVNIGAVATGVLQSVGSPSVASTIETDWSGCACAQLRA